MSLKSELNKIIQEAHYISIEDLERIVKGLKYKLSNAERRLRRSESPNIRPVMAKKEKGGIYIKGYEWVGELPIIVYRPEFIKQRAEAKLKLL